MGIRSRWWRGWAGWVEAVEPKRWTWSLECAELWEYPPCMPLTRWLIWTLLFCAATFAWVVYFEHGHESPHFQEGAVREFERLSTVCQHWMVKLRSMR